MHENSSEFIAPDGRIWGDGLGFVKLTPWIKDLTTKYNVGSMLEVGAGRGAQTDKKHWQGKTIEEYFNLQLYDQYDPAIPGIDKWPDKVYDCTIAIWVVGAIELDDFVWWLDNIAKRTSKFCFMSGVHRFEDDSPTTRTEKLYQTIFKNYWRGPDLYYLHDEELSPWTQDWLNNSIIKK